MVWQRSSGQGCHQGLRLNHLGLGQRQVCLGFIKLSLRGRLRIQAVIILGSIISLLGIIKRLVKGCLILVIDILPHMCIIVVSLRFIQIRFGNDKRGIVILDQGVVLPILLVVQDCLGIDNVCLRRGNGQLGSRDG